MAATQAEANGERLSETAFDTLCEAIAAAVGVDRISREDELCERHAADWSGPAGTSARAVVRPRQTSEIAAVLQLCHAAGQSVAVQGGRTGLAGGAAAGPGEIALSLERMAAIERVDPVAGTMTVGAGATLAAVQEAAAAEGLFYAVDLGARGSAAIGGTISTNAGGIRVLRYGMTRDQVLGLEVVLADGTVLSDVSGLVKNNSGFDLKQLFVGSEGCLGVIARAVLKLHRLPRARATAWATLTSEDALPEFLVAARAAAGASLGAFEAMWPDYLDAVSRRMPRFRAPLAAAGAPAVIVELLGDDPAAERERLERLLGEAVEAGLVADGVIAESIDQERRLWAVRDEVPAEYGTAYAGLIGFDVSFPVARMVEAVRLLRAGLTRQLPHADCLFYGHLGDANLHVVIGFQAPVTASEKAAAERLVYDAVRDFAGSVSAEHGIGRAKRPWLGHTRSPAEIATMRRLKAALDPKGILNPGRVLPG